MVKVETERLIVRDYVLGDEQDLCEYMLQRVDAEFEGYPDFTVEKSKEEIEFRTQSDEFYAIELKANHKVIGNVYMGNREFNSRELGYVLNEEYIGKGFGTEASKALVDYFFMQGVHRIFAECNPDNIASWKVMEKIGLKREAYFKKNVSFHNDKDGNPIYWDTYVYAMLNPKE